MTPGEYRLRVCYGKTGRLRYLSHLEVVHALERVVRRAGLPFAITQGFSPHMKMAFGPALPVGTAGEREYLDVWLTRYTEAAEVLAAMKRVSPDGLAPHEARYVADGERSLTAALTIGTYRVEIDGKEIEETQARTALLELLEGGELVVERKGKIKVFDLTRCVPKDLRVTGRDGGVDIELAVRMGPEGSLRPELLVREALPPAALQAAAVRTTRTDTLIEDAEGVWSRPM